MNGLVLRRFSGLIGTAAGVALGFALAELITPIDEQSVQPTSDDTNRPSTRHQNAAVEPTRDDESSSCRERVAQLEVEVAKLAKELERERLGARLAEASTIGVAQDWSETIPSSMHPEQVRGRLEASLRECSMELAPFTYDLDCSEVPCILWGVANSTRVEAVAPLTTLNDCDAWPYHSRRSGVVESGQVDALGELGYIVFTEVVEPGWTSDQNETNEKRRWRHRMGNAESWAELLLGPERARSDEGP